MVNKSNNREIAILNGLKTYVGKPCKSCGKEEKYVSNWACVECTTNSTKNRSPDVYKKYIKSDKGQDWLKNFRNTATYKQVQKRWLDSSGWGRMNVASRRKYIREQLDLLSEKELLQIANIYKTAIQLSRQTGIQYDIDHIIRVADGGRHHPDNLQILPHDVHKNKTSEENRKH